MAHAERRQLTLPLAPDAPQQSLSVPLPNLVGAAVPSTSIVPPAAVPGPEPSADPEIRFVRRRGARRYILRVMDDGHLRVTVPWWGSKREARQFVESQQAWIAKQHTKRVASAEARWAVGCSVLVDGVAQALASTPDGQVWLDGEAVSRADAGTARLRADVQAALRARARARLPGELLALATAHGIAVTQVSVRNQASRWGSCSRRGTISLNWRLVQTPPFVREYVLLHELMHRRELNHSARFWTLVAAVCPRYIEARRWLRTEGAHLFD